MHQFNLKSFLNHLQQIPGKYFKSARSFKWSKAELSTKSKLRWLVVTAGTLILVGLWASASFREPAETTLANPSTATSAVSAPIDTCAQNGTITFSCYKNELTNITQQKGPETAVDLIKHQYSASSYVKSQCHQLVHVVGRAALAKYGDIAQTYAHGDQFCWSGYYHGALEQLAHEKGLAYLVDQANSICANIPGKATHSFFYYNCVHGLGHGYMFVQNGDLFKSLANCDSLRDGFDSASCYGGVFMQNVMNEQAPDEEEDAAGQKQQINLKPDQPMYPCTAVADKYKDQCYLMQTSYALQVENYDFSKVFNLCDGVENTYRNTCYASLGRDASGNSISDITRTRNSCLLGSTLEAKKYCFTGAAKDFVSYYHSDVQAKQLCQSLTSDLSTDCLTVVKNYYSSF